MSSAEGFRQEMPPKGGFAGIQWERIPLKKPWSGLKLISAYILITTGSFWFYAQNITYKRNLRRMNDELTTAIEPLMLAERDRLYLNQLRLNRDEERELMKNVPGWKVGTFYGEPLYTTTGDFLMDPTSIEYYAHCHPKHRDYMHMYQFWM